MTESELRAKCQRGLAAFKNFREPVMRCGPHELQPALEALQAADAYLSRTPAAGEPLTWHRHENVIVGKTPPVPEGEDADRWAKHWDNCRRAEQMTSVAPITAEGWEKVAVMLMDGIDRACGTPAPTGGGEVGWRCKARDAGTAGGNNPVECDWPFCGCDPQYGLTGDDDE